MAEDWFPDLDVLEREGKLVVRADLPGVKREDIEVKLEGDALVISGHREEKEEVKEKDYYRCERQTGEFTRAVTLPKGVDTTNIEAVYDNGVLEVTVPKPAELAPKTVAVQVK
jgi:HSP20 family protein